MADYQSLITPKQHIKDIHKNNTTYKRKTVKNKIILYISYGQTEHNRSRQLNHCIYEVAGLFSLSDLGNNWSGVCGTDSAPPRIVIFLIFGLEVTYSSVFCAL